MHSYRVTCTHTPTNSNLESNKLTGSVAALTAFTNIQTLFVCGDGLYVNVSVLSSPHCSNLTPTQTIRDLSDNNLTGPIPKFLCDGHIQCDLSQNYGDFLTGKLGVCVPDDCGSGTVCNVDTSCSATVVVTDE